MRRFIKGSIYAVLLISLMAIPVMAAFSSTITVTESSDTDYDKIGVTLDKDVDYLADHGFITTSGRDVRITQGVTELDYMLVEDRINFVLGVSGNTTQTAVFTTDNTPQDYQIVPGYEGKITISDDAALELGNDFELEFTDTWVDTDAGADKNLISKVGAFQSYVSASGNITADILDIDYVSPDGFVDGAAAWSTEANAYDDNLGTFTTTTVAVPSTTWSDWLELTHASVDCTAVRFYLDNNTWFNPVEVDAYYGGAWHNVYDGAFDNSVWIEASLVLVVQLPGNLQK